MQVDNELFVHTMWPCEDPEVGREAAGRPVRQGDRQQSSLHLASGRWSGLTQDMALVYCRNEAFRNMPPGYCDLLKSHFRHKCQCTSRSRALARVRQAERGLTLVCGTQMMW